jgi:hypothetical protein
LLSDLGGMNSARELVAIGVALEISEAEAIARQPAIGERSRYHVANGRKSLGAARGRTLLPGQPCCAEDFERPVLLDADGLPVAAQLSGEAILANLVKANLVIDTHAAGQAEQRAAGGARRR